MRARLAVLVMISAVAVTPAIAHSSELSGTVRDAAGAVLPGVTVSVAGGAPSDKVRSTVTGERGTYRLAELPAGTYAVRFELEGFATLTRGAVNVGSSENRALDAVMRIEEDSAGGIILIQEPQAPAPAAGRMVVLLFDFTRLRQEDAEGSANVALRWIDEAMAATDLVAVVTIGPDVRVATEFTSDREALRATLQSPEVRKGAAQPAAETTAAATRGIGRVCETIEPIARRKAIFYFSAGVNVRNDGDQVAELREVTRACNRANASLYPVDARGLASVNGLMRTDPAK